ncbi:MAG: hypothetical protein A3I06_05835 [Candidatus Lindowbacteria bacterium RIFCSPLOWO2_02_FULL_62_12]|nr:MAG: hypothetical protein A3I06_05835 [Candidatus Lindowbacteria bacterium RIFCSPLOWO2_02_FULL_62_12]
MFELPIKDRNGQKTVLLFNRIGIAYEFRAHFIDMFARLTLNGNVPIAVIVPPAILPEQIFWH